MEIKKFVQDNISYIKFSAGPSVIVAVIVYAIGGDIFRTIGAGITMFAVTYFIIAK